MAKSKSNRRTSSAPSSPKEAEYAATRKRAAVEATKGLTISDAVGSITNAGLVVQRGLADLSETLIAKTEEKNQLDVAIAALKEELETLHGKDRIASSLDELVAEHTRRNVELRAASEEARTLWHREEDAHKRYVSERTATTEKERKREEDDYNYRVGLDRRTNEDTWRTNHAARLQQEQERQVNLERDWAAREAALKLRENELAEYKTQVEAFPAKLEAEVQKRLAIVTNVLKKDHLHELELLKRDSAAANQLLSQQVASGLADRSRLIGELKELNDKLDAAHARVSEISAKALDASSGRQALAELSSFAQGRENGSSPRNKG